MAEMNMSLWKCKILVENAVSKNKNKERKLTKELAVYLLYVYDI